MHSRNQYHSRLVDYFACYYRYLKLAPTMHPHFFGVPLELRNLCGSYTHYDLGATFCTLLSTGLRTTVCTPHSCSCSCTPVNSKLPIYLLLRILIVHNYNSPRRRSHELNSSFIWGTVTRYLNYPWDSRLIKGRHNGGLIYFGSSYKHCQHDLADH